MLDLAAGERFFEREADGPVGVGGASAADQPFPLAESYALGLLDVRRARASLRDSTRDPPAVVPVRAAFLGEDDSFAGACRPSV
jgi:hypothetical protein